MVESVEGLVNKTRLKRATCGQLAETNASLQPHTSEDELEQGAVATVTEGSQTAGNLKTKGVRAEEEEKKRWPATRVGGLVRSLTGGDADGGESEGARERAGCKQASFWRAVRSCL